MIAYNLPQYVVNLEDLARALHDGIIGSIHTKTGKERVRSQTITDTEPTTFSLDKTIIFCGVSFSQTPLRAMAHFGELEISVVGSNGAQTVLTTVPLKECLDTKLFDNLFEVDGEIQVTAKSLRGEPIHGVVDIIYYEVELIKEVLVICKDKHTLAEIHRESHFFTAPSTHSIHSPEPYGYEPLREIRTINILVNMAPVTVIEWLYEPVFESKVIRVQEYDTTLDLITEVEHTVLPENYGTFIFDAQEYHNRYIVTEPRITVNISATSPHTTYVKFYYRKW